MKRKSPGCKGFDLNYEAISKEYLSGGSLKDLAEKYNVSKWTLLDNFKKLGVRKNTKRYLDKTKFDTYTPESCYWAGFIGADGWINNNGYLGIEIKQTDKNHLEKIKRFLSSNADINFRERNKFSSVQKSAYIQFNSRYLINSLEYNFNIIPKKSLILQPPNIPENMIRHYIRGYFDGDGSLGWHKHNKNPRVTICSGSIKFLKTIFNEIKRNINSTGNPKIIKRRHSNTCTVEFMGKQCYDILDWLYEDAEYYLDRKYKRYLKYKSKR